MADLEWQNCHVLQVTYFVTLFQYQAKTLAGKNVYSFCVDWDVKLKP